MEQSAKQSKITTAIYSCTQASLMHLFKKTKPTFQWVFDCLKQTNQEASIPPN